MLIRSLKITTCGQYFNIRSNKFPGSQVLSSAVTELELEQLNAVQVYLYHLTLKPTVGYLQLLSASMFFVILV